MVETLEATYDQALEMFFREYRIQPGDTLSKICLQYGHVDWKKIYSLEKNRAFRDAFPDSNAVVASTDAPPFFIPLWGGNKGGKSLKGSILEKAALIHVTNEDVMPLKEISFQVQNNSDPKKIDFFKTDEEGNLFLINLLSNSHSLISLEYELVKKELLEGFNAAPRNINEFPDPASRFTFNPDQPVEIVAIPIVYVACPMCGTKYKIVSKKNDNAQIRCPLDAFNLTLISNTLKSPIGRNSFINPTPQGNITNAFGLKCRGTEQIPVKNGSITVFWDESRFVAPQEADYKLAGLYNNSFSTVQIIGRSTWGAQNPILGRAYTFHTTDINASIAYPNGIPSNESLPLKENVLQFITIHHSMDHPLGTFETVRQLQRKHQVEEGIGGTLASDIGYHYVIDKNGAIYEGRPLGIKGEHAQLFNGGNIGIVVAGDHHFPIVHDELTEEAVESLRKLVAILASRFGIKSVRSHQSRKKQVKAKPDTECPGDYLMGIVNDLKTKYPGIPGKEPPE